MRARILGVAGVSVALVLTGAACGSSSKPAVASPAASSLSASGTPGATSPSTSAPEVSGTVTVLAAASLTGTFTKIAKDFEAAHPGVKVVLSFGGSSTLAQQINQGAPADVFASASPTNMKQVADAGGVPGPP